MLKRQQKREFTVLQTSSPLFHVIHFVKFLANFSGRNLINPKGLYQSTGKEKENWCHLLTSSNKREILIRHFHVVVVQRRQRNLQNSVLYVQSCCVANLNLFVTCTSPKMHIICPPKFCISIVLNFCWDGVIPRRNENQKIMQNFGGQTRCIMGDVQVANCFFRKNVLVALAVVVVD